MGRTKFHDYGIQTWNIAQLDVHWETHGTKKNEIKIQKTLVTTPSAILYPPTNISRAAGRFKGNKTGGRGRAGKLRTTGHHSHDTATQCKRLMKKPANKWGEKKKVESEQNFSPDIPRPQLETKSNQLIWMHPIFAFLHVQTWGSKLPTEL